MLTNSSSVAKRQHKGGFFIGVTCPGCGGELELEQDLDILTCIHCGSVLRTTRPDVPPAYLVRGNTSQNEIKFAVDRYLKEKNLPLTGSDLYFKYVSYPYWKVDAVMLKVRNTREERVISGDDYESNEVSYESEKTDISLTPYVSTVGAGLKIPGVPETIGMRAQYIKMVPFSEENVQDDYDTMPVLRTFEDIQTDVQASVARLGSFSVADFGSNVTELMHPVGSVVYFPYVLVESYQGHHYSRFVVDGVTSRVIEHETVMESESAAEAPSDPKLQFGMLKVEFHRCRNCGDDLPPVKSFVNICDNCQHVNLNDESKIPVRSVQAAEMPEVKDGRLHPFWSFRIPDGEYPQVRRLFGGLYGADWFTMPAFKMANLESMYRLSQRTSAALPKISLNDIDGTDAKFLPVTVGVDEARMLANVIIFRRLLGTTGGRLREKIDFHPGEARLVFLPFHPEHYFYVDSILHAITFEKSQMK